MNGCMNEWTSGIFDFQESAILAVNSFYLYINEKNALRSL